MGKKSDKVAFTFSEGGSLANMADVPQDEMTTIKQETLNRLLEHGGEMMELIEGLKADNATIRALNGVGAMILRERLDLALKENELLRGEVDAKQAQLDSYTADILTLENQNAALKADLHNIMDTAIDEVAALKAEVEALRAVAEAAEWYEEGCFGYCPVCGSSDNVGHDTLCLYTTARAAGYLADEQTGEGVRA